MATPIQLGPFQLEAPIAKGGMGRVWRAVHRDTHESAAVKVLSSDRIRKESSVTAIRNEVRAMASLDHPHIIWVHDQGTVDAHTARNSGGELRRGAPWFAMELAESGTLRDRFSRMTWPLLKAALAQLLSALAHAHAHGVIHRDIKPANILYGGEPHGLKLTDFGLMYALQRDAKPGTRTGAHGGTPAYMPPEQCLSNGADIGPWTDLYSVGCLAWRATCGRHPYRGKSVMAVVEAHINAPIPRLEPLFATPSGFETWIRQLMQKDPSWRFQWAAEARRALFAIGDSAGQTSRPRAPMSETFPREGLTTMMVEPHPSNADVSYDAPYPKPLSQVPPTPFPETPTSPTSPHVNTGLRLFGLRNIPLVGRSAERDHLWKTLGEVHRTGAPHAVILHGAAGCGKSRLAQWAYRIAHELGVASVLRAFHNPEGGPADGVEGMFMRGLGIAGLPREHGVRQIRRVLRRLGQPDATEVDRVAEFLSPATQAHRSKRKYRPIQFRSVAERHEVGRQLLSHLSRRNPVLVWLDDVQWGLDAIEFAVRVMKREPCPVMFLLTARDDALTERDLESDSLDVLKSLDRCSSIPVPPLPREERVPLIQAILPVTHAVAERVAERTAGNPLFAVHLIGDWVDRGSLHPTKHGYGLDNAAANALPETLQSMWIHRVTRVIGSHADQWLLPLEVAAVLGQTVDRSEWIETCEKMKVAPHEEVLDALLDARLAIQSREGWAFAHGMLREAITEQAKQRGRFRTLHRACAEMLRQKEGPGVPARLGIHLLDAGDPSSALRPLMDGINGHFVAGEYGLAERLLDTWFGALDQLQPPASDARWGEGWLKRVNIASTRGEFREARRLSKNVIEQAQLHGWRAHETRALVQVAKAQSTWGPETDKSKGLERALHLAQELDDRRLIALVRYQMGVDAANHGLNSKGKSLLQEATDIYEENGENSRALMGWIHLAHIEMQDANYAQALHLLERAEVRAKAIGSAYGLSQVYAGMGEVSRFAGDLDKAEENYARSYRIQKRIGNVSAQLAKINVGLTKVERGQYDEGRQLLFECLMQTKKRLFIVAAHLGLLVCAANDNDPEAWQESLDLLNEWASHGRADIDFARMSELAGKLWLGIGQIDRAREAWSYTAGQLKRLGRDEEHGRIREKLAALK